MTRHRNVVKSGKFIAVVAFRGRPVAYQSINMKKSPSIGRYLGTYIHVSTKIKSRRFKNKRTALLFFFIQAKYEVKRGFTLMQVKERV